MTTDMQKIWETLMLIYGSDLQAATITLLIKDCDTDVKFTTIVFPQKENGA